MKIFLSAKKSRLGFALIFVLGFAALMAVFTAVIGSRAQFNLQLAEKRGRSSMSRYASMTGTQLALSMIRQPPPASADWLYTDGAIGARLTAAKAEAIAHAYHNISALPNAVNNAPDGTVIPPNGFYIISVGVVDPVYDESFNLVGGSVHEAVTMGSSLVPSFPTMPQAAFAFGELNVNGTVDHFDSRVNFVARPFGTNPEASVATAQLLADAVNLGASASVDGHVLLGDLAENIEITKLADKISVGTPAETDNPPNPYGPQPANSPARTAATDRISGAASRLQTPKELPLMEPRPDQVDFTWTAGSHSGVIVLEEGSIYHQTGNLVFNPGTKVTVRDSNDDGIVDDTLILVENNITITGAELNSGNPPRQLKIFSYAKDGDADISISNSEVYALVAGGKNVDTTVVGDATVWGAVMGRDVTVDGTVHYDVALRDPLELADIYGLTLGGVVVTNGSTVPTGDLAAPIGGPPDLGTTGTTGTPTTGTTTGGTTTTGGGGGGCGCGSMMMGMKMRELEMSSY